MKDFLLLNFSRFVKAEMFQNYGMAYGMKWDLRFFLPVFLDTVFVEITQYLIR